MNSYLRYGTVGVFYSAKTTFQARDEAECLIGWNPKPFFRIVKFILFKFIAGSEKNTKFKNILNKLSFIYLLVETFLITFWDLSLQICYT
jgi:hypothetical protein